MREVLEEVLKEVIPSEELKRKAEKAAEELERRLKEKLKDYPDLEFRFLGSFARDTWLPESLEIDAFILFPENYTEEELERIGLEIGKSVLDEFELRYAAHPYVHGKVLGVEADVVPCYKLRSAEKIKSAVDRTPFHHEWLKDRIKGKENDVRLLKRFLKASNLYGAEYKVRGFSGYLCELLIVFYGSFENLVREAAKWRRDLVIDVARREVYRKKGLKNIFVVDPVDEKRNVAANLSVDNLAKFVEKCRLFIEKPSKDFFYPEREEIEDEKLEKELENRFVYEISFEKPPIVEDNLYPQLERASRKISEFLENNDFRVVKSGHFVKGSTCMIYIETSFDKLGKIKKHFGPPFEVYEHAMRFIKKEREYKHFFEEGKYVTYVRRKFTTVVEAIEDCIRNHWKSLGADVGEKIRSGVVKRVITPSPETKEFIWDFLKLKA